MRITLAENTGYNLPTYINKKNTNKSFYLKNSQNVNDTFTFKAHKTTNEISNYIFENLAKSRSKNKLGEIFKTTKKGINVYIKEISLGKKAEIALTNGIFGKNKNEIAYLEISRSSQNKPIIRSITNEIKDNETTEILNKNLDF